MAVDGGYTFIGFSQENNEFIRKIIAARTFLAKAGLCRMHPKPRHEWHGKSK
jgi:hypothetical protein